MKKFSKALQFLFFGILFWGTISLGSCGSARTILQQADLSPLPNAPKKMEDPKASFAALETAIYGKFSPPKLFNRKSSKTLSKEWLGGKATIEVREYLVSHGQTPQTLEVVLVTPSLTPNAPLIISQNFSPNRDVVSSEGVSLLAGKSRPMGPFGGLLKFGFGRHIVTPPLENIVDKGYGFIAMYPPSYVADNPSLGASQLDAMFKGQLDRPGALSVWASLTTALAEDLKTEQTDRRLFTYGHSRYGKTALLAAVYTDAVDGVISHQSGTAGASLMRDGSGESLKDVVETFPHWLSPTASKFADNPRSLPSDSHALLAAIAPKPIFLGNARRDVWSDPEGAFQAGKWATQNSDLTFSATRLDDFQPSDDIAIWTRSGTHGVVKEDWPAFLAFLDAHSK